MARIEKDFAFIEPELTILNGEYFEVASYVRKEFQVPPKIKRAVLYITALGVFKAYLNGKELDQAFLLPGFTNYHKRLQYKSYDVTEMLAQKDNALGVVVGNGWYRGNLGAFNVHNVYGNKIKLAVRLEIVTETQTIAISTDPTWKATQEGPIRDNDLKSLEVVDMRTDLGNWSCPGYDDRNWHCCKESSYDGELVEFEGAEVTEHEKLTPKAIQTPNGEIVLDFGQNHTGHIQFQVNGISGQEICLEMGEVLDENGNFTVNNVAGLSKSGKLPFQTFRCVLRDGFQICKPLFLTCGYRYVKVTNWPGAIDLKDFCSYALYSDIREIGKFSCSDERINRFVSNVNWSRKSNFVDIPTDCPTRERAGWTGDINVFAQAACYTTDPRAFLKKWYHDVLSMQLDNGAIPYIAPMIPMPILKGIDETKLYSPAGWADVVCNLPMVIRDFFDDDSLIRENYQQIKAFVDHNLERAQKNHKLHFLKRKKHYKYILDTGYQFGEWLEPGSNMLSDTLKAFVYPDSEVATAWLYHSVKQLAEMATILGIKADQEKYTQKADCIRQAYCKEFVGRKGIVSKRQCKYVRPLYMKLISGEDAENAARKLNRMCVENGYKLATGFLTTYKLLQVLTEYGYQDTAYNVLLQKEYPGWMYEIEKGATTIWEDWMGIDKNGVPKNSLNHYAPGASLSWLYSHCAGIRSLSPGFERVQIKPVPGGDLQWVKASYQSIHGMIRSEWRVEGERFILETEVPAGIYCEIILPDGTHKEMKNGGIMVSECMYHHEKV